MKMPGTSFTAGVDAAFISRSAYPFHRAPTRALGSTAVEDAARHQLQQPGLHRRLAASTEGRGRRSSSVHPDLYAAHGRATRSDTMFVPASDFFGVQGDEAELARPRTRQDHDRRPRSTRVPELLAARPTTASADELATTTALDARHIARLIVFAYAATVSRRRSSPSARSDADVDGRRCDAGLPRGSSSRSRCSRRTCSSSAKTCVSGWRPTRWCTRRRPR